MIAAQTVRSRFLTIYGQALPRSEAQLLGGIVLGGREMNRGLKEKLVTTGLTHVVAASGMNISLLSGLMLWLISWLRLKMIVKAIVVLVFIGFYATLTGFDPPIVRAAIMSGVVLLAVIVGRQLSSIISLAISAGAMLWVAPALLSDPSFWLSFSSMTGQIILSSLRIALPKVLAVIIGDLLQSGAAILATFPLVLLFFSRFSLISLLTNALVLWTIEPLMILGGLMGIIGLWSTDLAAWLALPASGLLAFFLWVVSFFSQAGWTTLRLDFIDPTASFLFILGYYLLLSAGVWRLRVAKK